MRATRNSGIFDSLAHLGPVRPPVFAKVTTPGLGDPNIELGPTLAKLPRLPGHNFHNVLPVLVLVLCHGFSISATLPVNDR